MKRFKFEYRITFAYMVIGGLWILFSDKCLLYITRDNNLLTEFQTYKGWFYVLITAALLFSFLKKHLINIRQAEQKAIDNDKLKSVFLQNISHEIRTPMNGIIGFAGLLNDSDNTKAQTKQYIDIITKSSNQLLKIVNDILDISMIETGNSTIQKDAVNINYFLEEIKKNYSSLITKDIELSIIKGLSDKDSLIYTDEVKLKQIMKNLLLNAIKFTEKGHIIIGYLLHDKELEFFVEDSGIGIPQNMHQQIFENFQKSEPTNQKIYEGTGLGLAICKGYIELLQGKIRVKSEPGTGSTFYFTIPFKPVISQEKRIPEKKAITPKPGTICLLVVEDEELNYLYIKEIFMDTGIRIHHARNGKEAVDICRINKEINVILMDMKMPVLNGIEATRKILEFRPDMHIIAQTAFAQKGEREKALAAGCNDFILKPYKKEQMLSLFKYLV